MVEIGEKLPPIVRFGPIGRGILELRKVLVLFSLKLLRSWGKPSLVLFCLNVPFSKYIGLGGVGNIK